MKCVKSSEGKVKRVSDHTAELLMLTGSYSYCPKSEWKALRVTPVVAIVHTDEQKQEIKRKADKRKQATAKKNRVE